MIVGDRSAAGVWRVLDAATGVEQRRATLPGALSFGETPVVVGDRLVAEVVSDADGEQALIAVNLVSGAELWRVPRPAGPGGPIVGAGELVVTSSGGGLEALNARTGAVTWTVAGAWRIDQRLTDPVYANGRVFALRR